LLADSDLQANASMGCGNDARALEISAYDVMTGGCDIIDAMCAWKTRILTSVS